MKSHNYVKQLPRTAKQIPGSKDYADIDGSIYAITKTDKVIKKSQRNIQGYMYAGIYINEIKKCKTCRVHRAIARTFLPNPHNLPVVGHRNNIKTDNRVENLYWTTYKENTQKAVNDGLMVNDKGFDDSQSKPVIMFETATNKIIGRYGSQREAADKTGIPLTTISRQARYHRPSRKPYYFRYVDDESVMGLPQ